VPRTVIREPLNKSELSRHTADSLRSHRLSVEAEQQPSRDRRRREDEIREELHDSRARTIAAPTQKPQPS
jgi:hypothetical protein